MKKPEINEAVINFCQVVIPHTPVKPLKGGKRVNRMRLSNIVSNPNVPKLAALIPATHKADVSIRRSGGYGSTVTFVSAEIGQQLWNLVHA